MNTMTADFRRAAIEDDGCPISAGLRTSHVRAVSHIYQVNLSAVPDEARPRLIAAIEEMIAEAVAEATTVQPV